MSFVWVLLGLLLLVVGGEFLVRSSVALSFKLKLSKLVIGMTVVSFATSAPELLVSLQAALDGSSDISLGNVIGSNIANIGLVLGVTAIISPLIVDRSFFKLNWPMMMIMSLLLYVFLKNDQLLSKWEGVFFMAVLILFLIILIRDSRKTLTINLEEVDDALKEVSGFKIFMWLLIGALALYFGSEWLVFGAKELALALGVSEYAISVTVIAIGTSVPELAASVIAALKKEKAISLGNLIGSNIFNICSVLGLTAIIKPIQVNPATPEILSTNIFWMIGIAAVLLPMVYIPRRFEIYRYKGFVLLGAYILFVYMAIK
ncbi:calcium/sodium antiporter [Mangrovimonas sp. AS39]|uniref:calcium/sodium antiporter n=1 Tax=Mangrovimonas futianensis TaxID=2895523 RepID=UPI001E2A46C6|nr:calcium/sodium antiporter [Mangrovimonas futianensis]MCF1191497.1 calcium/sodium antiporter [Mangrovimonas futianensis]MCF1195192.1 calcium/sodium antiporter [Mangrovimonas futianensis]MCF1421131.1 calcium/sodium antiporter [Mangrovimonas futianensis]